MKSLKETIDKVAYGRLYTQETRDLVAREVEELSNPSLTEEEKKALQKYQNWLFSIKTTVTNNKECSTLDWNVYPKVKPSEEGEYLCAVKKEPYEESK